MSTPRAALGMLPLVFLVGGARGFGYSQTVDNCAETPHTFDRSCVEDCPQCTPIAVTERGQDLSDATECVCIEGSLMGDDDSSDDDASKSWTLTPYDDCAFISNLGEYVALHAGAGNDVVDVKLAYRYSIIDAGAGDDDVSVMSAESKKIDGGAGDDAIYALRVGGQTGNELRGGKGDDTITLVYSSVDVFGDAGDDAISVTASSYSQLFGGDGDDTIDIGSDEGDDVITANLFTGSMSGGAGDDTLSVYCGDCTVITGGGDDVVSIGNAREFNAELGGGDDALTIDMLTGGTPYDIRGGNGDDDIHIKNAKYIDDQGVYIDGSKGDDKITVDYLGEKADYVSIDGGGGDDACTLQGTAVECEVAEDDDDGGAVPVTCEGWGQGFFCDCAGDCEREEAWCQCDEAQACCAR
ncbi:hypothetical protein AURANDRAFT_68746 [Aureococcus anophagefferens]|uniref:Uncharacterized protein n=1 Tax=Aureococcus anophagefferens TaxID=44056 RepID=F0YQM6_AURAN|nr:hypothetical protein AURANDRAFT_68746 [Aureococcus anophagefferens]EGB02584.1 hypothetical protein AURANDRAFT_68746 [Aureococcus anophagefferens]|eukprot:XP_009042717.1 hypothetical protein AURANDRAFT_68746 [Aureococcus anophagefferens]